MSGQRRAPGAEVAARRKDRSRRRRSPGWVPDHHGAWAMITIPALVGVALAGPDWRHLPLLALWWTGYFAFFATGLWLRSRRRPRYLPPVRAYGIATAVLASVVLVTAPFLALWAVPYAPLVVTTFSASAHRRDRSLVNDVVTVGAAGLMTAVAYDAGTRGAGGLWGTGLVPELVARFPGTSVSTGAVPGALPGAALDGSLAGWPWTWVVMGLVTAYFLGTILYVKTNIRERGSRPYLVASVAFHALGAAAAAGLTAAGVLSWTHAAVWTALAVRSYAVPAWAERHGRTVRPMTLGIGEIVFSVLVALTLLLPG